MRPLNAGVSASWSPALCRAFFVREMNDSTKRSLLPRIDAAPTLAASCMENDAMRATMLVLLGLSAPGAALAQSVDCSTANLTQARPQRATVLTPLAAELASPSYMLGAQSGVLAHAYDESQSVDQVLLRLRIEGCRAVAKAMPAPTAIDPNDPSVYKPKTEFDNTPWRFDMSQNGKRMTAEEFDAWMKARGVRVARGAAPAPVPAATVPASAPGTPPGTQPTVPATVPVTPTPTTTTPPAPAPAPPATEGDKKPD
jgi:hypothetical protein